MFRHGLMFRVHGETAGLEWQQEDPNHLRFTPHAAPVQILESSGPGILPVGDRSTRLARGHPEGYYEAFANLYSDVAEAIAALELHKHPKVHRRPPSASCRRALPAPNLESVRKRPRYRVTGYS